jgi:hypothetical protein
MKATAKQKTWDVRPAARKSRPHGANSYVGQRGPVLARAMHKTARLKGRP